MCEYVVVLHVASDGNEHSSAAELDLFFFFNGISLTVSSSSMHPLLKEKILEEKEISM